MNNIEIRGDIAQWNMSADWLAWKLKNMNGDITVEIFSYGGDVFEGIAMYNMLREYSKTKGKVTTINMSMCASIASLVFLAGDIRKAYANATIMIHKAWMWTAGNYDELIQDAKMLNGIDNVLINTYSETMNDTKENIKAILKEEGWYIGQEQMAGTNFVDEFIESDNARIDLSQAKATYNKAVKSISARAKDEEITHDFKNTMAIIKQCNNGECPLDVVEVTQTVATDALLQAKTVNLNTGVTMKFNRDNLDETEKSFNALVLNRDTLTSRNESIKLDLETQTVALETLQAKMTALQADVEAKVTGAKAEVASFKAETATRIEEAMNYDVSTEVVLAMVQANSKEEATKIVLDANRSNGDSKQSTSTEPSGILAYAQANKGSIS